MKGQVEFVFSTCLGTILKIIVHNSAKFEFPKFASDIISNDTSDLLESTLSVFLSAFLLFLNFIVQGVSIEMSFLKS